MSDPTMIVLRFVLYAVLALLFGVPLFGLIVLRVGGAVAGQRRLLGTAAMVALAASCLWLAMLAASMGDTAITQVSGETYGMILTGTAIGTAWMVRMGAIAGALALLVLTRQAATGLARLAGLSICGAVALSTLAWTGHGAMDEGVRGWVHLVADILHLLAAGAWVGALFAFLALLVRRAGDPYLTFRALHGFASIGTVLVLVLLATGIVNGWVLVGPANLAAVPHDPWERLMLVKLALFVAMLGLAAANRYRLTPALGATLEAPAPALARLRRSLLVETAAAMAILLLVGWLGQLSPATV